MPPMCPSSHVVEVVGELALDPLETVAEGRLELLFHGVHVVGSHPLPPLELRVPGWAVARAIEAV